MNNPTQHAQRTTPYSPSKSIVLQEQVTSVTVLCQNQTNLLLYYVMSNWASGNNGRRDPIVIHNHTLSRWLAALQEVQHKSGMTEST